jgi:cytidine deaminase
MPGSFSITFAACRFYNATAAATLDAMSTLNDADRDLIDCAIEIIRLRYKPGWHAVGAALRTCSGRIVTGVHLEDYVGRAAVCAEAIALGRAVTEHGESRVDTIVAVRQSDYTSEGHKFQIVAPCGMCREMLSDYSPEALVIVPSAKGIKKISIADLLPGKYTRA